MAMEADKTQVLQGMLRLMKWRALHMSGGLPLAARVVQRVPVPATDGVAHPHTEGAQQAGFCRAPGPRAPPSAKMARSLPAPTNHNPSLPRYPAAAAESRDGAVQEVDPVRGAGCTR